MIRGRYVLRQIVEADIRGNPLTIKLAQMIVQAMTGDRKHPSLERTPGIIGMAGMMQGEQDVLDKVLALAMCACGGHAEPPRHERTQYGCYGAEKIGIGSIISPAAPAALTLSAGMSRDQPYLSL